MTTRALGALAALALLACRAEPDAAAPGPPRLLLLLTADTLRADRLGAYGSDLGLTPHLDALAAESVVFEVAYAPAPLTLPSMSALFTSRFPEENGIFLNEATVHESLPTLATRLRGRGWRTAAVVSNFVLRKGSGLARGFDHYDDDFSVVEAVRSWPERIAEATADALLAALDDCTAEPEARCLLWGHFQDPHGPYTPPPGRREKHLARDRAAPGGADVLPVNDVDWGEGGIPAYQFLEGRRDVGFYRAGYHGEIEYLDEQIGRVLDELTRRGLDERSVVVFAADHGEALGEDDVWFAHGERLHDAMLRVPLLLRAPGLAPHRRADVASLVDVAPTLLRLLEDVELGDGARGRDLLAPGAEEEASVLYLATPHIPLAPRRGIVEDGYKLVLTFREDRNAWDGRLSRIDREETDLAAAAPQVAAKLRRRLAALQSEMQQGLPDQRQPLSQEDRAALRALGYGSESP